MFKNENASYWLNNRAGAVQELAKLTGQSTEQVAEELAYIAGDHADMPDADVLETFNGDHGLS